MFHNIFRKTATAMAVALSLTAFSGCIDEEEPTDYASGDQIKNSSNAQQGLVDGLVSFMVSYDTYGTSGNDADWGYPCFMLSRDCMTEDFPIEMTGANYDYFTWCEENNGLRYTPQYMYFYYYKLIHNASDIINSCDVEGASKSTLQNAGIAYVFRAMAYLDLARMFEFKTTGYSDFDAKAKNIMGLTVPIVTEKTGQQESKNNPRAPFYTMYRFILSDLTKATQYLDGYTRPSKDYPDQSVAEGLLARYWLELGSRFEKSPEDLSTQLSHENDEDGYTALGITTANECFEKAQQYAQDVIRSGYSPVTQSEWYDKTTGFNTANQAWIWCATVGSKEQCNSWYMTWMGTLNSGELNYTLGTYGNYRAISKALFDRIPAADWRKKTWVDPNDAGASAVPQGYSTLLNDNEWANLPAYANLKYKPGSGSRDDWQVGLLYDVPLMRVEEMYFIAIEAMAHTRGVAAAAQALQSFVNSYRYTNRSYVCSATDMTSFIRDLMTQKRIELWAEGLVYFDYKRLGLAITRDYDGTNFYKNTRMNSKDGYCAPWLNMMIPEIEQNYDPAVVLNPDPTDVVKDTSTY